MSIDIDTTMVDSFFFSKKKLSLKKFTNGKIFFGKINPPCSKEEIDLVSGGSGNAPGYNVGSSYIKTGYNLSGGGGGGSPNYIRTNHVVVGWTRFF